MNVSYYRVRKFVRFAWKFPLSIWRINRDANKFKSEYVFSCFSCKELFSNQYPFIFKISEKDCSNIATIVSGILNGNLAVPTITFSQALDFLFELGAEKLKKDYQTIIKNFYSSSESAISAKWR